jgi:hypothetical protein
LGADDKELHEVERGVEADREPQRSAAEERVAEHDAERHQCDDIPDVLSPLEEIVQRREHERDRDCAGPEAEASPERVEKIGAKPKLFGQAEEEHCAEPGESRHRHG